MACQRVMGWAVLLVVLLAASRVVVQAEDAADEQTLFEWTVTKIKDITDSASSTAFEMLENGKKRAETISNSAKEYTDYAKESFTRTTSGKKEPDSKALELLEKSKKMAFDKYQAAKDGSAELVEAAKKRYDAVSTKLSELTQQVEDKMANKTPVGQCGQAGARCHDCNDCCGAMICCGGEGSGSCLPRSGCKDEGLCPPPRETQSS